MCTHCVGSREAPNGVAKVVAVSFFVVVSGVNVEVEIERLLFTERNGVIEIGVIFLESIFQIRSVKRCAQIVGEAVAAAENVDGFHARAVAVGFPLLVQRGEATGVDFQTFDFSAGQQGASGGFRQQAAVVSAEYRQGNELVAVLENRVGNANFNGSAGFAVFVRSAAIVVLLHFEDAGTAFAAVQFDAEQAVGVCAETDGAFGEA